MKDNNNYDEFENLKLGKIPEFTGRFIQGDQVIYKAATYSYISMDISGQCLLENNGTKIKAAITEIEKA